MENSIEHTQHIFESEGGEFITPPFVLMEKLKKVKAFIFDWDGVFNEGVKGAGIHSGFSEVDSMGTNMLRFSNWLLQSKSMPLSAVITGANNDAAVEFAAREHFDSVYFGVTNKKNALDHLITKTGLKASEIAFFYDDILDLPIAEQVGVRVFVKSRAKVAFSEYLRHHKLADYITEYSGGEHGVREASEMIMGLNGNFVSTIEKRMHFSKDYKDYLLERNRNSTVFYTKNAGGSIIEHYVS